MFPMDLLPRLSHAAQIRADQFDMISGPDASPLFVFTERICSWPVNRTGVNLDSAWRRWEDFVSIFTVAYTELRTCGNSHLREKPRNRGSRCALASFIHYDSAPVPLRRIVCGLGAGGCLCEIVPNV
jgi:hypothetical protein